MRLPINSCRAVSRAHAWSLGMVPAAAIHSQCDRPSGKRPYVIHILPLATSDDPSAARALVMIIDPEQETEPPKMLIRRIFGLTNAEADVALRVMRGDGLKPISDDLELAMATIKTHLQHIFDKTDTHRQAELVRLLLAIAP